MGVCGLRTVQLARRRDGTFGFSVRGGREHGSGVFVSQLEPGSDAELHGLKVGDEVLRVNGLTVQRATHREVVTVIRNSSFVQLRVRDVGLLPVKEYVGSPLVWRTVETIETRLYIGLTGQTTLGCSICKGPPGWPGVFVQSTKEVGLAREVGLKPGDQIIQCNGVSFIDIDFAKAVYVLKMAQHLDLTIRRGVGADLFAARSSGYNSNDCSGTDSSNSSVTLSSCSPHPPGGSDRTLVETSSGDSREPGPACRDGLRPPSVGDRGNSENALTPSGGGGAEVDQATLSRHQRRRPSPSGDPVADDSSPRSAPGAGQRPRRPPADLGAGQLTIDRHRRWQEIEAEWAESEEGAPVGVVGPVTRLEVGGRPSCPPPPPPALRGQGDGSSEQTQEPPADDRPPERQVGVCPPPPPMMSTSTLIPTYRRPLPLPTEGGTSSEEPRSNQQHDQLMEEFKLAHKKMFAHKEGEEAGGSKQERQGVTLPRPASTATNGLKRSRPVNGSRRGPEVGRPPAQLDKEVIIEDRSEGRQQRREQQPPPPPPPPPPPEEEKRVNGINIYTTPTLTKLAQTQKPPATTPAKAVSTVNGSGVRGEAGVETQSLDSFTLEHPASAAPKPPPTYFDGAPRKRDVLVSIGAYSDNRPAPARLQFLGPARRADAEKDGKFERVATQLQHELVQTLSRANLRHRTGSVDNLLGDSGASQRTVTDKYGSVLNIHDNSAENGPGGGILKNGQ